MANVPMQTARCSSALHGEFVSPTYYCLTQVFESRVTLIVGQTGTGKSSRVPQMLQEELQGTVLCTQPRRLAVVAIAKRVAQELGCVLGEEVGYRIGEPAMDPQTGHTLAARCVAALMMQLSQHHQH